MVRRSPALLVFLLSSTAIAEAPRFRIDVSVAPGIGIASGALVAADSPTLASPGDDPQTDALDANDSYLAPGTHGCPADVDGYCVRMNDGAVSPTLALQLGGTYFFASGVGLGLGLRVAPMAAPGVIDHLVGTARLAWRSPRASTGFGVEPFLELGAGALELRPRQDRTQAGASVDRPYARYGVGVAAIGVRLDYAVSARVDVFAAPTVYVAFPDLGFAVEARLGIGVRFAPAAAAPVHAAVPGDWDRDGILDAADRCVDEPEDVDAYLDEDGCPDLDDDGDGVPDATDACRLIAEDRDGFEDADGCPDSDDDDDGLPDTADSCPHDAGPATHAGCPVDDRDGDGVPDRFDNCPDEAGSREFRGCILVQRVAIEEERITIDERIHFERNSDVIEARSHGILDELAAVIAAHPEIAHVRVEGHTDATGTPEWNQHLSTTRAESVARYLVSRGIEPHRVSAFGYGAERPVVPDADTEEAHAQNRRVEFVVLRR